MQMERVRPTGPSPLAEYRLLSAKQPRVMVQPMRNWIPSLLGPAAPAPQATSTAMTQATIMHAVVGQTMAHPPASVLLGWINIPLTFGTYVAITDLAQLTLMVQALPIGPSPPVVYLGPSTNLHRAMEQPIWGSVYCFRGEAAQIIPIMRTVMTARMMVPAAIGQAIAPIPVSP